MFKLLLVVLIIFNVAESKGCEDNSWLPCSSRIVVNTDYFLFRVCRPESNLLVLNWELSIKDGFDVSNQKTIPEYFSSINWIYVKVPLPERNKYAPVVTKIILNDTIFCTDPDNPQERSVKLRHTLDLNLRKKRVRRQNQMQQQSYRVTTEKPRHRQFGAIQRHGELDEETTIDYTSTSARPGILYKNADDSIVESQRPDNTGINDKSCGISSVANSLIVGGSDIQRGQYPWLVAIYNVKNSGPEFICGGSIVTHKHVLTAAHCMKRNNRVRKIETVFVRLGKHNLRDWLDIKTLGVSRIAVHEDYRPASADADISVLTLTEDVEFTPYIRPVCLWNEDIALSNVVGELGVVAGWGMDESTSLVASNPKQVTVPIVSQVDCLRSHAAFRELTSKRTFCAGHRNGTGPCNGDSGGAFLMKRDNRWTLRGIVSHSLHVDGVCDNNEYVAYCDVTNFLDWIKAAVDAD